MVTVRTGRHSELANGLEHVLLKKLSLWDPETTSEYMRQVVAMGEGSLRQVVAESLVVWEEVTSEPCRH